MAKKLSFGVEPNMREVPPGEHAVIQLGKISEWKTVETEWGQKYSFPILLLSHPDYPNLDIARPLKCNWVSKSVAALHLYAWIYGTDGEVRTFDFDIEKELKKKWKVIRHETGGYALEQQ